MQSVTESILDLARWAPSGDNSQPWRFEIRSDREIIVHAHDTRATCVYDLDGRASQISHGALLETLEIAATRFGVAATTSRIAGSPGHTTYAVRLSPSADVKPHPLLGSIVERVVQRGPMGTRGLNADERSQLARAAAPYDVVWWQTLRERLVIATLNARNAHIRLTIPEAYEVHKAVIEWNSTTSEDRLPDAALGASAVMLRTMRWAMASWPRMQFMNRYLGGTLLPRLALDLLPGLRCSAHFCLIAAAAPQSDDDYVSAGRAVQRFWLAATRLGLQLQPSYTPLVFARYAREQRPFTSVPQAQAVARQIAARLDDALQPRDATRAVFLGRIGPARAVKGRSLRLPVNSLILGNRPPSSCTVGAALPHAEGAHRNNAGSIP